VGLDLVLRECSENCCWVVANLASVGCDFRIG
jgi:hypothetical protein